jgi:hypothetical protein
MELPTEACHVCACHAVKLHRLRRRSHRKKRGSYRHEELCMSPTFVVCITICFRSACIRDQAVLCNPAKWLNHATRTRFGPRGCTHLLVMLSAWGIGQPQSRKTAIFQSIPAPAQLYDVLDAWPEGRINTGKEPHTWVTTGVGAGKKLMMGAAAGAADEEPAASGRAMGAWIVAKGMIPLA